MLSTSRLVLWILSEIQMARVTALMEQHRALLVAHLVVDEVSLPELLLFVGSTRLASSRSTTHSKNDVDRARIDQGMRTGACRILRLDW